MSQNKTWFLRDNDFLKGLSANDLALVDSRSAVKKFRRKTPLWSVGESPDHVYWIRNGIVRVSCSALGTRSHILAYYSKGELVGETAVFSDRTRTNEAVAYDDVTVLALERTAFVELGRKTPAVLERVGRLLAERRAYQEQWHSFLIFRTVPSRLAGLFLRLARTFGVRDSRGIILNLKLTHREMAAFIGATRETVSFAILALRKQGTIETEGKRIILVDMDGIQQLLNEK